MLTSKVNNKYIYSQGEKIYDFNRKKNGTVKYLRDDSQEKSLRQLNSTHYYYFIEYDDNSFDTYVNGNDFIPVDEQKYNEQKYYKEKFNSYNIDSNIKYDYKNFNHGQRFYCEFNDKYGTVIHLRDDSHEKLMRQSDSTHYYYHVDFDDGSFETYIHGIYLKPI